MNQQRPEFKLLAVYFCQTYNDVFGREYWLGKKWTEGKDDQRTESDFQQVLEFFDQNKVKVTPHLAPWRGYIKFALQHWHKQGKRPLPTWLVDERLLKKYFLSPAEKPASNDADILKKISDPNTSNSEWLQLLGISPDDIEQTV